MAEATPRRPGFTPQPLWVRVDRNRAKLAIFVVAFVAGSAVLLTSALVVVPGSLIGWALTDGDALAAETYWPSFAWVVMGALAVLLAAGSLASAVQLANAEDWVRSRFSARPSQPGSHPAFESAIRDMAIAAGLSAPPHIVVVDSGAVNAYALGTARARATIGVTTGFLKIVPVDEQRAVVAALAARIVSGDILFATALAALMGPLKAVRGSGRLASSGLAGCADGGCMSAADGCSGTDGCSGASDGCGCLFDGLDDDSAEGCLGAIGIGLFVVIVAALTYLAVLTAAWLVTAWGRALHRTAYEKADAEGMLLLKDPVAMLAALQRVIACDTAIADGDVSYDGIFYAPTSGTPKVETAELRRLRRLAEVLGVDGAEAVAKLDPPS